MVRLVDYFVFGQEYIRPWVDFRVTTLFSYQITKLKQIQLLLPCCLKQPTHILLRNGFAQTYIAGDRVLTDPPCKPFSIAPFDSSVLDNLRRLAGYSAAPAHINPLALLCHEIMPPPRQVEKEIGEKRMIAFHGVGLSAAPEISFSDIATSYKSPEEGKEAYTQALYNVVTEQYNVLKSAIHGKQGLKDSVPSVSLPQTWI